MSLKRANQIAGGLFGYTFASFATFFALLLSWNRHAPTVPDPSHGAVYAHSEHGGITFFTAFQATSCALLFFSGFLTFVLCMIVGPKKNVRVRRLGRFPVAAAWDHEDPDGVRKQYALWGGAATLIVTFLIGPPLVNWLNSLGVVFAF